MPKTSAVRPGRKLILVLTGGLGNQLFQYSSGLALSLKNQAEFVLDNWSGFVRDTLYRRQYELNKLHILQKKATSAEKLAFWIYHFEKKYIKPSLSFSKKIFGDFIVEQDSYFDQRICDYKIKRKTWMIGYWQSPKYFENIKATVLKTCMPLQPLQSRTLDLGWFLRKSNSIALGLRFYEESNSPLVHANNQLTKTIQEISFVVKKAKRLVPNAKICVFSTIRVPFLSELQLGDNIIEMNHENGFTNTLDRLWLISNCRHHIFNNSSFYWWGAYLSENFHGGPSMGQVIFAADNFINQDMYVNGWNKF